MAGKGGLSRLYRPVKGTSDRKRREKVQRKRLIGLGMPEAKVLRMNSQQVRIALKEPVKLKARLAKAASAAKA
jgi:hypothetical protein